VIGTAHFFSRRFDQAVPKLLLAIQEDYASTYRVLAVCYAHFWGDLTRPAGSSSGCAPSSLFWCRTSAISATPSNASCISRVCLALGEPA
jgi:hypothetical protein